MNGYQDPERKSIDRLIDDWFALLQHGHIVTATGNSDTHHLDHNIGGYPRNYVRVQEDAPSKLKEHEIERAVKGHHAVMFTTAPFLMLSVGDGGIGDVAPARNGHARWRPSRCAPRRGSRSLDGHAVRERPRGQTLERAQNHRSDAF